MITNINKKVICVKDIPSNLIEEAIFILKTDTSTNKTNNEKRKEIAQKEAEDFLSEYLSKFRKDNIEEKNNKKIRKTKLNIALITVAIVVTCYILFLFK